MIHDEYISEGYAIGFEGMGEVDFPVRAPYLSNLQHGAVSIYENNKSAKVGSELVCPTCGKHFIKKSYQHAFCRKRGKGKALGKGNLCKDTYHNSVSDKRRARAMGFN